MTSMYPTSKVRFSQWQPQNDNAPDKVYHLLTGGTGLLGGYMIRDLLSHGHRLAVLVRPTRKESARQRIEAILAHHEQRLETILPRPVVIEGDLTDKAWQPRWLDWLSRHCRSVIHCGASLTFNGAPGCDPWKTNLDGTRNILDLCRSVGVGSLHYFSTAYVAGSYRGNFSEDMLDVGQELRNDYEKSKFEAEIMVRDADFINSLTVYRPSIVVGDSRTCDTSTYHGYYAVLKLAHTLVNRLKLGDTSGRRLLSALGMNGGEHKNFVPVDWVSEVFAHVFSRPLLHGRTYHLTNPSPTKITDMVDTIQRVVEHYSELADETDANRMSEDWFKANYAANVATYRDYLNDDPNFLCDNTFEAAPETACPKVDPDMMYAMGRYAVERNFGKNQQKSGRPFVDVEHIVRQSAREVAKVNGNLKGFHRLALRTLGPGGGEWTIFAGHDGLFYENGVTDNCDDHVILTVDDFVSFIRGDKTGLTQHISPKTADLLNSFSM